MKVLSCELHAANSACDRMLHAVVNQYSVLYNVLVCLLSRILQNLVKIYLFVFLYYLSKSCYFWQELLQYISTYFKLIYTYTHVYNTAILLPVLNGN